MTEDEHADLLKADRLAWLADTMAMLRDREQAEPGYLPDWSVMALHASTLSWIENVFRLDIPA